MSATSVVPLHVCDACGTVDTTVQQALAVRDEQIASLQETASSLEMELRSKRSQIKRLKSQQDASLKNDPHYADAIDVLEHWRTLCAPKARELGGKRLDHCLARLRGQTVRDRYTVEELKRSIEGYSLKPYVVNGRRSHEGTQEDWHADAELIFRDPKHVDQGIRIAERADDLRAVLSQGGSTSGDPGGSLGLLGEAALRFAANGWSVFPCRPRDKKPATANGLKDAKRDQAAISATWTKHPDLNVGVPTGAGNGIIVLDVDGEEGVASFRELEREHGAFPLTASVKTPRGGSHFYFRHPGVEIKNTAGWPRPGLDIRGDGGYVLAPPSVGAGGRAYEPDDQVPIAPMPGWLVKLLTERQKAEAASVGKGRDWAAFITEGATQGQRNDRMTQYVGHMFSHGHPASEVLELARLLNQRVRPPLSERELGSVVSSIARAEARKP